MHTNLIRGAIATALVLGLLIAAALPARADGSGGAWGDPGSGDIGVDAGDGAAAGGGGGGGSSSGCTYTSVDQNMSDIADDLASHGWGNPRGSGPGAWYRKVCPDGSGTVVWIPDGGVDPAVLAQQAFDQTNIPLPGAQLNPPSSSHQVVNLESWMWVDNWQTVSASATAGTITATVTAVPVRVVWSMGNGDQVTCNSAGTAYDPSVAPEAQHTDCSYTYRHSSASAQDGTFTVRATEEWHVTWSASGIVAGGDFGLINRNTDIAVRVAEIQAVHE
jgi:hypothetical protein